jgi:CelD/BcsL family acetyltransferase involved in cellulose biosynthesis
MDDVLSGSCSWASRAGARRMITNRWRAGRGPAPADGGYRLRVTDELASLRAEWVGLGDSVGHPFATWEWLSLWWQHFGGSGHRLRLVSARDGDGRLLGIVPLYRSSIAGVRMLRYLGHGPSDTLGPIVAPGSPLSAPQLLRRSLAGLSGWDVLIGEDMRSADWVEQVGGRVRRHTSSPVLDIDGQSWEAILATKSHDLRKKVRRADRSLRQAYRLTYRLVEDPATLDRDFATLVRLHTARWGGSTPFANPRMQPFHAEFARVALARGWLRMWLLELDDQPVAAWYGLRFADQDWAYQGGRDPRYDHANVGFALHNHTMREAATDGVDRYQFLRGGDAYKLRWATRDPGLDTVVTSRGLLGLAAVTVAERARALSPTLRRMLRPASIVGAHANAGSEH